MLTSSLQESANNNMFKLGLTGGIASGKTLASDYLATLGASIIDTDLISRDIVRPNQHALHEIERTFGSKTILENGELNRPYLRELVFNDPLKLEVLNNITHPIIREHMLEQAEAATGIYAVCVIPLLAETGQNALLNRVLVIDIPAETQLQRLLARDDISQDQAIKILEAQASREQRLAIADDVIENNKGPDELYHALEVLHHRYIKLANS